MYESSKNNCNNLKKKKKYKTKKKTNFENQQFTYVMYHLIFFIFIKWMSQYIVGHPFMKEKL